MPSLDLWPAVDFSAFAPQAGFGQAVFFSLVMDYLDHEIVSAFNGVLSRALQWVSATALILMTLWIWWQGFRIVTGRSREAMLEFFAESAKRVFILSLAFGMAIGGTSLFEWLANDLPREVNWIVTGEREQPATAIDRNLAFMQLAMSSIDVLQTGGDAAVQDAKTRSMWFAAVGTAGPAMVGGAMLLLNKIAMGLFIGFGPLFVLALLFDATKPLFQKWLYYGIGTIFALVLLNLMVEIATEMVTRVAGALWLGSFVSSLMGGAGVEGITSRALQQGGLGMLLSVMIVSTPPMAAAFFNGVMGSFTGYNAFGGGGGVMATGQPYHRSSYDTAGAAPSAAPVPMSAPALRPELLGLGSRGISSEPPAAVPRPGRGE
ncbi:MAG: type IV secretion system protein [Lysobacteraceae bacterium]|jgi:type IV secretion system protein VirB6|nr:type IV secretion system protein [Xanthomonadaceae bacterium]MCZ8317942.1 type IV secretion system protein [Silanimonas sp.]